MSFSKLKKRFYFVAAKYFRHFADKAFRRWNPRVIAITGSAGKTTMMTMVEHEIGKLAHYSHDANSAFGIPFDILGLKGIRGSNYAGFGCLSQRRSNLYLRDIKRSFM